jgi:hypothetical protein
VAQRKAAVQECGEWRPLVSDRGDPIRPEQTARE